MSCNDLNNTCGDVDHSEYLSNDIGTLFLSDIYSDMTLIVDGERFNVHKIILAVRSQYFRALFFGGLKESIQREIELKEPTVSAFKELLKYIYTGQIVLFNKNEEIILDILLLAHEYSFSKLESSICQYLKEILNINNVCVIFDAACLYQFHTLIQACHAFIDKHASIVIHQENFLQLSSCALINLLSRDSFFASEIEIFKAVHLWIKANPDVEFHQVLEKVRLNLISVNDLLNVVRQTGLVSSEDILDLITDTVTKGNSHLKYRGFLSIDQNVANYNNGTEVLKGEQNCILHEDNKPYDFDIQSTSHLISTFDDGYILIKLGTQCIINHIKMLLCDRDTRSYSYFIEVSMDKHANWVKIIDYSNYLCRSWQYLYFEPRVVLYIRIVGTYSNIHDMFHLLIFKAYFTHNSEELFNGIIIPTQNVAITKQSACVNEGVSRKRNTLLNGDLQNYDWERGYTCHQLNTGCIQIQLGQPYMIDSMRLLLWDCDDRSYSYYVEVSGDADSWEIIVDKRMELCRSWQVLHFKPARAVVFIRIVGTNNTANGVFHCVHFECPAQVNNLN